MKFRAGVATADTDYGVTLLDQRSGNYWTLNPTAAMVVRTLLAGGTPEQAAEALTAEYMVDGATAAEDVADLISRLRSANLVEG